MDQNITKTKKEKPASAGKFSTHLRKHKYLYIYGASVVVFALLTAVGFILDALIADLSAAELPAAGEGLFGMLTGMLYNPNAVSVFSLFQVIVRVAAVVGILIFIAKSSGAYQVGFVPFFPENTVWFIGLLVAVILTAPAALYTLFAQSYTWSVILLIAMAFSDAAFIAFGWFMLRKAGVGKVLRIVIPLVCSYVYYGIFIVVGSLTSSYGFTGLDIMRLALPDAIFFGYVALAPLFMVFVYTMTNSIIAMAVPMLTLTISCGLFHGAIQTMEDKTYPVILFIACAVACLVLMIAMLVMTIRKLVKKIPLPTDLLCEAYAEGAPEVTFPESAIKEARAKKEKKEKKAQEKNEFAFLDEADTPVEEKKSEDTTV